MRKGKRQDKGTGRMGEEDIEGSGERKKGGREKRKGGEGK